MSGRVVPYRWGGNPAKWLSGAIADIPTPFDASGAVDLAGFAQLCERQIAVGAAAIVVGETAGETSTLTPAERDLLIRSAVEVSGKRVHVIAGAGSNATGHAIEATKRAAAAGADAILSVTPYYNRPMQAGIDAHFRAIADATALPIIVHDHPARTARGIADDVLARLAQSSQFVGLRDSTGDIARVLRLRAQLPAGFRLLSGDDATLPAFLAIGGDGSITAIANLAPDLCAEIHATAQRGRWKTARRLHRQLLPLITALAGDAPAALKYALSLQGLIRPDVRLPLVEPDAVTRAAIAAALAGLRESSAAENRLRA